MTTLTPDTIRAMPAGPEMDKAVARLMGLPIIDGSQPEWDDLIPRSSAYFVEFPDSIEYGTDPFGIRTTQWSPSTDIAAAWEVLEHLGKRYYPNLQWCESGNWRCTLELNDGDGPRVHGVSNTTPDAICRAALLASLEQ